MRNCREKASADVYRIVEPLLALLTPEELEVLKRRFDFQALKWGRRSALWIGALAVLNLGISLGSLAQGRDTFWDFLWLLAGGYLCIEQVLRWRRMRKGHPAGSILGCLVRPLPRSLLALSAAP